MKMYGIATSISQVYGHGSCGDELVIQQVGDYGTGGFPLLYRSRAEAQAAIDAMDFNIDKCVVALQVAGDL